MEAHMAMQARRLGKTGWDVSPVSLGTWQVGGRWGDPFDHASADALLHRAIDLGVNFIDTADVYSDGLSEEAVGRVVRSRSERVYVATKCGRRLSPHVASGYTAQNLAGFVEDSLRRTGLDVLDLVQLHCPPSEVIDGEAVYEIMDRLKDAGKIRHYGVSVEKVSEALSALRHPGVATLQIIFNLMRQKPTEEVFTAAAAADVGILARVPLASGLLTGRFSAATTFGPADHRTYNRKGEAFDRGETFSGVDYELGLKLVEDHYGPLLGKEMLAAQALRWVLMFDAVSTVIPGASSAVQVERNLAAATLPPLSSAVMGELKAVYDRFLRAEIHGEW
jgi:aryl-alcohol dehydrogenase-like predicted oxidoreductase